MVCGILVSKEGEFAPDVFVRGFSMPTLGIDISNYSSALNQSALAAWKRDGVGLVITQAVDPPPGYPAGKTRAQCQAVIDAEGIALDAYLYLWYAQSASDWKRQLALLDGFPIRRLWIDVEDTSAGFNPTQRIAKVAAALAVCDVYPTRLGITGVYTGSWHWIPALANTTAFSDRPWWPSQYDYDPDTAHVTTYGGWHNAAIKQYAGTSIFDDVSGVDLDVLSTDEAANLFPPNPGGTPLANITVGTGMQELMASKNDTPLKGHKYYSELDDNGKAYEVEECYGSLGLYISSNSSGNWVNAGPLG